MLRSCAIVPAFDASQTVGRVIDELRDGAREVAIVVIDDGSSRSARGTPRAMPTVPSVLVHARNLGKGGAIATGLREAARRGLPRSPSQSTPTGSTRPSSARMPVLDGSDDPRALVLGVRDLVRDGAPERNRFGNAVSNFFLSFFAGQPLRDTQCGLRRYPVRETLDLGVRSRGYAFEAEVVLRALAAHLPLVELPVDVIYPPEEERRTHFEGARDPMRIVATVTRTVLELRLRGK